MIERTPARRTERRVPLRENPILLLHGRQIARALCEDWRTIIGRNERSSPVQGVVLHLVSAPVVVVMPYVAAAVSQWLFLLFHRVNGGPPIEDALDLGALVIYVSALGRVLSLASDGASSLARERDQRGLEALLLTRLSAADVVLGKAAAVLLPTYAIATLTFAVWLLHPPIRPGGSVFHVSCEGPTRLLLTLLWMDLLALGAACTLAGIAIGAWVRSSWGARLIVVVFGMLALLAGASPALGPFIPWVFSGQQIVIPLLLHPRLWCGCAVVALVAFVAAQVGLDPMPRPVHLFPGAGVRASLSRRRVGACLLIAALAILLGSGSVTVRNGYRFARSIPSNSYSQVNALVQRKQYRQALTLLDGEIRRGALGLWAWTLWASKGECHQELKEYDQAAKAFARMRRGCPVPALCAFADWQTGICELEQDQWGSAIEAFRRAVESAESTRNEGAPLGQAATGLGADSALAAARSLALLGAPDEARRAATWIALRADSDTRLDARQLLVALDAGLTVVPRMGIRYRDGAPTTIRSVHPQSSAARAGLVSGDRVLSVDGCRVKDYVDVTRAIVRHRPGDRVPVVAERAGKRHVFRVRLRRPARPAWARRYEAETMHKGAMARRASREW